ncbi:MAG: hypothetical protein IKP92_02935 [Lachnospiraceae bacterium]|nr:hypothetical protein [Lachnospiraceae bacterium]
MLLFNQMSSILAFGLEDIANFATDNMIGNFGDDLLQLILYNTIYRMMYYIAIAFCKLINIMDMVVEAFTGARKVYFDGDTVFLANVFFQNHTVSNVYWGMALLGIVLAFCFAIVAVVRRIFDLRDKDQRSMGQILGSLAKTILLILSMNVIIVLVLNMTNILLQQVGYTFDNAEVLDKQPIDFTDEEFAAMGRCLNTIGNYSLNPSRESRYNVNACYNEIRPDLDFLKRQGVFDYYYEEEQKSSTIDGATYKVKTWQSLLQKIANAGDVRTEMRVDVYNESIHKAITEAMNELEKNPNLRPLNHYEANYTVSSEHIPLDRYIFLICTFEAAKNTAYNEKPELTDAIRAPYYYGSKSIYNLKQVNEDFDISVSTFNYLIMIFMGVALVWDLAVIVMTTVSRIFNMLMLYLISPLVFAAEPLDDGAKRKQWVTAFLVQSMGIFGTIVAMRVLMIFIPIIISPRLQIFEGDSIGYTILDVAAKVIMIYGGFEVVKKANGIITGILADSAGWQSIQAGDMSDKGFASQQFFKSFLQHPLATTGSAVKGAVGGFFGIGSGGGGGGGLPPSNRK